MRVEKGRRALPCQLAGGPVELGSRRLVEPVLRVRIEIELSRWAPARHQLSPPHVRERLELIVVGKVDQRRDVRIGVDVVHPWVVEDKPPHAGFPRLAHLPTPPPPHPPTP